MAGKAPVLPFSQDNLETELENAHEEPSPKVPFALLPTEPKKIFVEVVILYGIAIGSIGLFKALSVIPFVYENLWGIAGIIFLFLPVEYLYRKRANLEDFGICWKFLGRGVWVSLVLIVIFFPPYILGFKWWFSRVNFDLGVPWSFWKEVVGNLFLVALPEEAFYRGYMQTRLDSVFTRKINILGAKVGWSVVVTAAFFALGHLIEPRLDKLGTFFPGLVFGWLRAKTGSIGGAVIFHASCNIWAQILYYGYIANH